MAIKMNAWIAVAGLAAVALCGARPASADLLGQAVNNTYLYPDTGSPYQNDGTQTVTAGGVDWTAFGEVNTHLTPNTIDITIPRGGTFDNTSFNGISLTEVGGTPVTITGVTVDPLSSDPFFDPSRISFTANNIQLNFQGLSVSSSTDFKFDIQSSSNTPEPGSIAMLATTAMSGAGMLMRRRRASK